MTYTAGRFADVAFEWGDILWLFLNEPGNVRKMTEASDLGKPAASAISQQLYDTFGDPIRADRVKQFIGYLIRQVMECEGYAHHAYGCKTPQDPVFSSASVYRAE
jgi:hypothetical protein